MEKKLIYKYYCRLCWQEFDEIAQHNAGSYLAGERLNGYCDGDIQLADVRVIRRPRKTKPELLPFDNEPLEIK